MQNLKEELEFYQLLKKLLNAITKKDIILIKEIILNSTSINYPYHLHKGLILEHLIAILINGNSMHAYVNPLVKDGGNDLLVYTQNYELIECIQAKNLSRPLNASDINIEVSKHERSKFKRYPFIIISYSGFTISQEKSLHYKNKGIFLKDFTYIMQLINNFNISKKTDYLSSYFLKDPDFSNKFKVLIDYNIANDITAYNRLPEDIRSWCTKIRSDYKKGKLDIKKKLRLDSINFYWDYTDVQWDISYNEVKVIFEKYGSTYFYVKWPSSRKWVKNQIKSFVNGSLPNDKFIKLNKINIIDDWLLNVDLLN